MHLHRRRRRFHLPACAAPFFIAALVPASAAAADALPCAPRQNALIADLGLHVINVGYQRTLTCAVTLQATAGLYVPWMVTSDVGGLGGGDRSPPDDVAGAVLRVRSFLHPLRGAPEGLWISPFAQLGGVRAAQGSQMTPGVAIAAGVSAGWTFLILERWLLAIGAGAQYHHAWFGGTTARPGFARLAPTIDLNVGYAF